MRLPPRRILAAVDFSRVSLEAWAQARLLASRTGADLEALHVRELAPALTLTSARFARTMASEKAALKSGFVSALGPGAKVLLEDGDPAVAILRLARTRRPDLLVLGTHGRRALGRLVLGSVAESVARRSPVPVLAVRSAAREIRSILAPVNFTPYSDLAFGAAAALAAAWDVPLTALHVCPSLARGPNPRFELENMLTRLPAGLPRPKRLELAVREGTASREIVAASRRHGLVVLAAHVKSGFRDILLGSTAERVLRSSPVPVLAVPDPRKVVPERRDWAGLLAGR